MDVTDELASDSKSEVTVVESDIISPCTTPRDINDARHENDAKARQTTSCTSLSLPPHSQFNMDNILDDAERLTYAIRDAITDIYKATLLLREEYPTLTEDSPRKAASRVVEMLEHFAEIIIALPAEGRTETALLLVTHVLECHRAWANCNSHGGYQEIEHGRAIYASLTEKCRAIALQKILDTDYPFPAQAAAVDTKTVCFHLQKCTELCGWPFQIPNLIQMWVRIHSDLLPFFVRFCTDTPRYSHHFQSLARIHGRYTKSVLHDLEQERCKQEDGKKEVGKEEVGKEEDGKARGKKVSRKRTWRIWS
ncbi:uncharacterized protein SPSK_04481 [Sporothrix schenckii 1099-18]|uniref:Uncharacterized protein n=1 Tax=Sporothrix schenckii 1099-18 TaxID=1397361 RepID=A0A0F2M486_SPOSC|nr:uncharacterized protein SPSK_04481 [Sporothrix schenckii 1099-18]KJR83620.1 hypothetical protein SPSK_04481 [Sporothrix schenckii 1099-18]